jgi:hypothetical protein
MEIAKLVLEYLKVMIWPLVVLIALAVFRRELRALINSLQHLELPGGAKLDWKKDIQAAEKAAEKVEASPKATKPHTVGKNLDALIEQIYDAGFKRSLSDYDFNYYRNIATSDPNLALAGLRMELERMLQNIAIAAGIEYNEFRTSPGGFSRLLLTKEALSSNEYELLNSIIKVSNAAIHGRDVAVQDALRTIDSAEVFKESYLAYMAKALEARRSEKRTRKKAS